MFILSVIKVFILTTVTEAVHLAVQLSESGIQGNISFIQDVTNTKVLVNTNLKWTLDQDVLSMSWSINQFPVDYTVVENRCDDKKLGKIIIDLDTVVGPLSINSTGEVSVLTEHLSMIGKNGLWGRSLLVKLSNGLRLCGTLMAEGKTSMKVAHARFNGPIAGSVLIQWVGSSDNSDAFIYTDLYHTRKRVPKTQHKWKIFTTDVLDSEADKSRKDCNVLQVIYEPHGQHTGDLDAQLGLVSVGNREMFRDVGLGILDLHNKQRHLYLVIYDNHHQDSYLACARIMQLQPVILKGNEQGWGGQDDNYGSGGPNWGPAQNGYTQGGGDGGGLMHNSYLRNIRAVVQSRGLKGSVILAQDSFFTPTYVSVNWTAGFSSDIGGIRIHQSPAVPDIGRTETRRYCEGIGDVFNPSNKPVGGDSLPPGEQTQDGYAVGDLSGKVGYNNERKWDIFLPLRGKNSLAHRSLVVYRNGENGIEEPWVCSTLTRYVGRDMNIKVPMATAEVIYRYPIAGRIVFRQPSEDWTEDTTILMEMLVHADGTSLNDTKDHRWGVSLNPPGKDFYNWTARCVSAGAPFDPFQVYVVNKTSDDACTTYSREGFCRVGSLSERIGMISIAGRKLHSNKISRRLFTDNNLPLSGQNSIIGRSLVLYDDNGPKARGDRLACSRITNVFRRKGVVRDWFGNGIETSVNGKIEFFQQTEYDSTDLEYTVGGLEDSGAYHIHEMPVKEYLEFPCEESTLYNEYNPYNIKEGETPLPRQGTPDQYMVGDLSNKFGYLNHVKHLDTAYNDTSMYLFGQQSVLGRSVVIFKEDGSRWTCGSVERGYSPSEARELRAIASFHHPNGFAYGYIRMTQLIHYDGSASDTIIEVNVRHPGKMDRNITRNHNWAIYVNPVGVDAAVKVLDTRCTAGGYVWNPYYTQLADPLNDELYRQECGPDHPLRCYVGDISGRLGTIDVGDKKRVFSDPNFPLEGPVSAMGRSIVILNKDKRGERFACANIEPDKDTVKYVNVRRPPKFIVDQFLEDVREVMGIPEWFLTVDSRRTKLLHGGQCVQLLVHFKGPEANKLEQDFSRLLSTGRLEAPSLYIFGYLPSNKRKSKLSYKLCGSGSKPDMTPRGGTMRWSLLLDAG